MYKSFTSKAIFSMEWQVKVRIEVKRVKKQGYFFFCVPVQDVMLFGRERPPSTINVWWMDPHNLCQVSETFREKCPAISWHLPQEQQMFLPGRENKDQVFCFIRRPPMSGLLAKRYCYQSLPHFFSLENDRSGQREAKMNRNQINVLLKWDKFLLEFSEMCRIRYE